MSHIDPLSIPPPQPSPDLDTERFWRATAEGRLELARCTRCREWHHPPLENCRRCAAPTAFEPISGRGTVYSFVVQRQAAVVGYFDRVPYVVAVVELDEQHGLRLTGRVVDVDFHPNCHDTDGHDDLHSLIGSRVEAELVDLAGGDFRVPVWRRTGATAR